MEYLNKTVLKNLIVSHYAETCRQVPRLESRLLTLKPYQFLLTVFLLYPLGFKLKRSDEKTSGVFLNEI